MNGTYMPYESWEKQSVWKLDNGWIATTGYSVHYGEFVQRFDIPTGKHTNGKTYWHCSDGIEHLPDFAKPWLRGGDFHTTANMVLIKFNRVFPKN
jgi:hypothetical protein